MITGPFSRRLLAQQPRVLSQRPIARVISRPLSYTVQLQARKDAQGKDDLKPEPNEYSKSGSDDEAARVEQTAFDPKKTSPEEQHDSAESESAQVIGPRHEDLEGKVAKANHVQARTGIKPFERQSREPRSQQAQRSDRGRP